MSIIKSLIHSGSIIVKTTAKVALVATRVAVVSAVTTTAAITAIVVDESSKAANEILADPNVAAGVAYAKDKAAAIDESVRAFEERHR